MPRLKVYRTPIGFHDAYVAATSQKAALKAWGSDADLFARGVAEIVIDPALTAEPLARAGEVVRRSRGTPREQLAALSPDRPTAKGTKTPRSKRSVKSPRPDRAPVDAAEQALTEAEARHRDEDRALAAEEAMLAKKRQTLRATHEQEIRQLEAARDAADAAYATALKAWRDAGA